MASFLGLNSSFFVPDSTVNYECIIINCLLIGSRLIIIESIQPMLQNSDEVCNCTAYYADSCIDKAIKRFLAYITLKVHMYIFIAVQFYMECS